MGLVRDLDREPARRSIVASITSLAAELDVTVIAEGVETIEEASALTDLGIHLHQGFLHARPAFDALADVDAGAILAAATPG